MLTPANRSCKRDEFSLRAIAVLLLAIFASAGCSTVESQSFRVSKASVVESARIATDADFSNYDRLLPDEMGIFFPQNAKIPAEDIQRIRQIFRNAFIDELQGYTIVQEPGPGTMRVQASLIDLRNSSGSDIPNMRREVREIAKTGSLVFMMEMRDSGTDRVLARAADSASTPTFATSAGTTTDWSSVEAAAKHWALIFRQFLDQNLTQ